MSQAGWQTTIARPAEAQGSGLHTGLRASVRLEPAPAGHGVVFRVRDGGRALGDVALHWRHRVASRMNTALALPGGAKLRTVEHLAASLSAFAIDNVLVSVEGRELPIFDGSAVPWCHLLSAAGTQVLQVPRRVIRVTRPIQVAIGDPTVRLEPAERLWLDVTCREPFSGHVQVYRGPVTQDIFVRDLARSRSSGGIAALRLAGILPRIGLDRWTGPRRSPDRSGAGAQAGPRPHGPLPDLPSEVPADIMDAIAFDPGEPVLRGVRPGRVAMRLGPWTLGGARYPDELVRHYALDLLGDLALAGAPLLARVVAHRPTHRLTYALVTMLARRPECWEWADAQGGPDSGPGAFAEPGQALAPVCRLR